MPKLQAGVFELPVMLEAPSTELTKASTEQAGSSTKHWVDNRKPIFTVELLPATTVHALDGYIDRFLSLTAKLQLGKCIWISNPMGDNLFKFKKNKVHSLCKQCLHDLHFLKKGSFSPNLSKLSELTFYENKIDVQNFLLNEWILVLTLQ